MESEVYEVLTAGFNDRWRPPYPRLRMGEFGKRHSQTEFPILG